LCAGLAFSGWRLLSDELALICPRSGELVPNPRPVSLKNQSIPVMQKFAPGLRLGSQVRETSKGVVAHFAAPGEAVSRALQRVRPGWVVLPRWVAGHPTRLRPLERAQGFMKLVENAFNYPVFGGQGFEMLAALVDQIPCYSFDYSDLDEATELFNRLADGQTVAMD
jgi:HprK-related kinase A